MKSNQLTIRACPKCKTPTARIDDPIPTTCDLPALTPPDEARAWLADITTYEVRTTGRRQTLRWRNPSPHAMTQLAHAITTGQPHDRTVLAQHECPGPALTDIHLSDWQPRDRAAFRPKPKPRITDDEVPF